MIPVNSNIPLSVQTPQFTNPAQLAQQRLTLQQLANTNAIQQQVQKENALKLQAAQEDQNDQQTFQDALKSNTKIGSDGVPKTDWDSAVAQASPNMRIRNIQAIQNEHLTLLKNAAEASDVQQKQWTTNNAALGRAVASVYQAPVEDRLPVYQQAKQGLLS